MLLTESDLQQLTRYVWAAVLGDDAFVDTESPGPALSDPLTGCAEIRGAWDGMVLLRCSAALVRRAACVMFQVGPESLTAEQVQDTLAELTNITAGNVKSLMEPPSYLSLPSVMTEEQYARRLAEHRAIALVRAAVDDQPLMVVVLERTTAPAPCRCAAEGAEAAG